MLDKTDKVFFGIALASIMVLGGFSFSSNLLPEADAAVFAKYDGIDGESDAAGHTGWSDVLSFSFGVEREMDASSGDRTTSRPIFSDFTITKQVDKSSPILFLASARGDIIPSFTLEFVSSTTIQQSSSYLKYELINVMITSYSVGGGVGGGAPIESISLNFEEIKVTYKDDWHSSWNIAENRGE